MLTKNMNPHRFSKILVLLFVFILNAAPAQVPVWIDQTIPSYPYNDITRIPGTHDVIAVGDNGIVMKILNGARNWKIFNSGTNSNLNFLSFPHDSTGYAIAGDTVIIKTVDGGEHWNVLNQTRLSWQIHDLFFCNNLTGYVLGDSLPYPYNSDRLIKTTDGGMTWDTVKHFYTLNEVNQQYFLNPDTGFIGGNSDYIFRTLDGGMSWDSSHLLFPTSSFRSEVLSLDFTSSSTGFAVVKEDWSNCKLFLYKTIDFGTSWNLQCLIDSFNVSLYDTTRQVLKFIDGKNAYYLYHGLRYITSDSGQTWMRQPNENLTVEPQPISMTSLSPDSIFFASNHGFLIDYSNGMGLTMHLDTLYKWRSLGTNLDMHGIYFIDSLKGFAINNSGIQRTLDGGNTWFSNDAWATAVNYCSSNRIQFTDPINGYITCQNGKTRDGGINWESLDSGYSWKSLSFVDSLLGYTISNNFPDSSVAKTIDGGHTWNRTVIPGNDNLFDISAVDHSFAYLTTVNSQNGGVYKTSDGGQNWSMVYSQPYKENLIKFLNDTVGFLGDTHYGWIQKSTDGGLHWNNVFSPNVLPSQGKEVHKIQFINPQVGYAMLYCTSPTEYLLLKTKDFGNTWNVAANFQQRFDDIWFVNDSLVYGVSFNGMIKKNYVPLDSFPTASFEPFDLHFCIGDTLRLLNHSTSGLSDQWLVNGVPSAITRDYQIIASGTGAITVQLIVSNSFSTDTSTRTFIIDNCISKINGIASSQIIVSPNPVVNELQIRSSSKLILNLILYDLTARKVFQKQFAGNSIIDLSGFQNGIYLYEIRDNEGNIKTGKIIKN
jgi:photosystem II stability/assembly factor-like uncharacterized protein